MNRSKVKEIAGNMQITQDFYEALDVYVEEHVKKACKRANANNRNTLMKRDV